MQRCCNIFIPGCIRSLKGLRIDLLLLRYLRIGGNVASVPSYKFHSHAL